MRKPRYFEIIRKGQTILGLDASGGLLHFTPHCVLHLDRDYSERLDLAAMRRLRKALDERIAYLEATNAKRRTA